MKTVTATIHWILAMCHIPCGASHIKAWDHPLYRHCNTTPSLLMKKHEGKRVPHFPGHSYRLQYKGQDSHRPSNFAHCTLWLATVSPMTVSDAVRG